MRLRTPQRGLVRRPRLLPIRKPYRPSIEVMEDRLMLDGAAGTVVAALPLSILGASPASVLSKPPVTSALTTATIRSTEIVVGRTPSTFTAAGVTDHQLSITYTAYNEQAASETGVLLTVTLQPGVTFVGSSSAVDQSGQNLAWSLGTINGFNRASVTLTVSLAPSNPLQLDAGAAVFATLDAAALSNTTAPLSLRAGAVDASLLASTPDANWSDPFVQQKAAELNYSPERIFAYLRDKVGYESYEGSLRGARGTLWSGAGNSLDETSLGVALMRASGIPARYAGGVLSDALSRTLILSMFPPSFQTLGVIPIGTVVSDPANDPKLLAEARNHYWLQFDIGSGFQDADTTFADASIGQARTAAQNTFTQVPDALRQKTTIRLNAEITNSATGLFGLPGQSLTTVLNETFLDVDLVGRPLTIGHFVQTSNLNSLVFGATTNVYSPYLLLGDDALDSSKNLLIRGQDYQEFLTNFPFGSQILTGLFLEIDTKSADGSSKTSRRTLVDRIGPGVRANGGSSSLGIGPDAGPLISPLDLTTISVASGDRMLDVARVPDRSAATIATLSELATRYEAANSAGQEALLTETVARVRNFLVAVTGSRLADFEARSSLSKLSLSENSFVRGYLVTPRISIATTRSVVGADGKATLQIGLDLLKADFRTVAAPGQAKSAEIAFNLARGMNENAIEGQVLALGDSINAQNASYSVPVFAGDIIRVATSQGILLTTILPQDVATVSDLPFSADIKARLTAALDSGKTLIIPSAIVPIRGKLLIGWFEINGQTGETVGVLEDGSHGATFESVLYQAVGLQARANPVVQFGLGVLVGTLREAPFRTIGLLLLGAVLGSNQKNPYLYYGNIASQLKNAYKLVNQILKSWSQPDPFTRALLSRVSPAFRLGFELATAAVQFFSADPPLPVGLLKPPSLPLPKSTSTQVAPVLATRDSGTIQGELQASIAMVSGDLTASWTSLGISGFLASSFSVSSAMIRGADGSVIGSGAVRLTSPVATALEVAGIADFRVVGKGQLSLYGTAETDLGIAGEWKQFTAAISGPVTITITTGGLELGGVSLPAGTFTITTSGVSITGSGPSVSPVFANSASIEVANGVVQLGPASGSLTLAGQLLDLSQGVSLSGFAGTLAVEPGGQTDRIRLQGVAANMLRVLPVSAVSTDQNTPVTFQSKIQTSFSDTYTLTAQAPPGWTVTVDTRGSVTATPDPGLQGGTYLIHLIAKSTKNPDLVAQGVVNVTITPTTPGITLSIAADPIFTVPFNGAQLPTTFQASIQNLGPTADTYNLTFANIPSGFTLLNSKTSDTVPAGQTGILGLYLQPNTGQPIPAPGTQLSFNVTATSKTNSAITKTQTVTLTVPAIDAVTMSVDQATVTATAGGTTGPVSLTLKNVGNVAENVVLSDVLSAGLTADGLGPVTLQPGQSASRLITFGTSRSIANNTTLNAAFTATYGQPSTPQTATARVSLIVRSQEVVAVQTAANAASGLSNGQIGTNLSNLVDALSQLQGNPTDVPSLNRVQFLLGNLNTLLQTDPALAAFVTGLNPIRAAASAGNVSGLLSLTSTFFVGLSGILNQEAAQQFTLSVSPTQVNTEPGVGKTFPVVITNTGTATENLTLSVGALPANVSATFGQTLVTLAAGASISVPLVMTQTLASAKEFNLQVNVSAGLVQHSAGAVVGVYPATADVLAVTVSPATPATGAPVSVAAEIFNTANVSRNVLARLDLLDSMGNVISTPANVPVNLVPGAGDISLNLGQVATTGLANGLYLLRVTLLATDGTAIPGQSSQTAFEVGQPVTATVAADKPIVLPGTSTVRTTVTIVNQSNIAPGGGGGGTTTPTLTVQVGYADGLRANPFFPNPWLGSPNTVFAGDKVSTMDSGAIRIVNNSTSPITVNDVSVTRPDNVRYDLWGSNVIPAGSSLILAETNGYNFDSSDYGTLSFPQTYPDGETAHATHVDIKVNGVQLPTFLDTGHVLTTGGSDLAAAGSNESQNWRPIGTTGIINPGGLSALVSIRHNLPGSGYNVDPLSISPTATTTTSARLDWNNVPIPPISDASPATFQLSGTVANMRPGEVRRISMGTTVAVSVGLANGQQLNTSIPLAPVTVASEHIIGIVPPARTTERNTTATYNVSLTNPLSAAVTYALSTDGLGDFSPGLATSITLSPNQTLTTPLTLSVPVSETEGTRAFTVFATTLQGAVDSVEGRLTVSSDVALATQALNLQLNPKQAVTGPGVAAIYDVLVTNVGDSVDTYSLAASLPAGFKALFANPTLTVAPGLSNAVHVRLALTPPLGTVAGDSPFTVQATSTSAPAVSASANGMITVTAIGVGLTLTPSSASPGSTLQVTVKNTGTVSDTFDLALAGPAALVSTLSTSSVTLAPGASQVVPITTTAVNFAVRGDLSLMAMATSRGNPKVRDHAASALAIPSTQGLSTSLSPAATTLAKPGLTTLLLTVNNTGNAEDSYTATITGTTGPVTASLVGLDGLPTQTIPIFRLPGLSQGAILVQANLSAIGNGTITLRVTSLTSGTLTSTAVASLATAGSSGGTSKGDGPKVVGLSRYGIHWMPTTVVLTFDQPLDPSTATNVNNYVIIDPRGQRVAISSAVYDDATKTVTLHPSRRMNFHLSYKFTLLGATAGGIANPQGVLLDGNSSGQPGSDYNTVITRKNLVYGKQVPAAAVAPDWSRLERFHPQFKRTHLGATAGGTANRQGASLDGDNSGQPRGHYKTVSTRKYFVHGKKVPAAAVAPYSWRPLRFHPHVNFTHLGATAGGIANRRGASLDGQNSGQPRGHYKTVNTYKSFVHGKKVPTATIALYSWRPLRFHPHFNFTHLSATAGGIANPRSALLDGQNSGQPGSHYKTVNTHKYLVHGKKVPTGAQATLSHSAPSSAVALSRPAAHRPSAPKLPLVLTKESLESEGSNPDGRFNGRRGPGSSPEVPIHAAF